jgi:NAD(P) transhydrogenase
VYDFDVLVLGSGPSGQKAAIAASKLGRKVGVIDRRSMIGGVCINTGTIPSKTLREAVLYLTGPQPAGHVRPELPGQGGGDVEDLSARTQHVISRQIDVIRSQLARNRVAVINGTGRFADPHTISVDDGTSHESKVSAEKIIIAAGTRPARPDSVDFDDKTIVDSDGVLNLERVPRSMVVVGAGVIGIEYASMFAALGTKVTVVERRNRMLEFVDLEIIEALKYHLRDLSVTFRFGEEVASVERHERGAIATLVSGKRIAADTVMYSGRAAGPRRRARARRGRPVRRQPRPHQGERALRDRGAAHLRRRRRHRLPGARVDVDGAGPAGRVPRVRGAVHAMHELQPIGIYTIPEISFVGRTEDELTDQLIPFEVGISRYRELARGQITGDSHGMLKLLVAPGDRTLLGVHVFGTGATELVHIGQAVMGCGGTIDYLVDAVFNYPTLAESYKVAALDAMNKIRQVDRLHG